MKNMTSKNDIKKMKYKKVTIKIDIKQNMQKNKDTRQMK
jgi:hypothetical protein